MGIDIDLKSDPVYVDETSGCTANSVLITQDWRVFCSNAGDSRSVLSCKGTAIPLSFDHKPTNELETKRIIAAGGFVDYGRVNGNLALSRALGDFDFKKNTAINAKEQAVTSFPDIIERQLNTDDEFIILACDGIWDCMSNQDVVDFCLVKISLYDGDLNRVAEDIMDYCLAPDCDLSSVGCDNMTAIVVALLRDKSKEEWVENIKTRTREKGLNPDDFKVLKKQGVMTGNTVYTMPMGTTESPLSESV